MDEKLIKKLEKTGLNNKEARVYEYLIGGNGAYPSDIALKTGINRSTCYKTLTTLAIKGVVSEIEKGKKLFYQAEPPYKIERVARYGVERAEHSLKEASKLTPELEGLFNLSEGKPKVTFYTGKEQVAEAYMRHTEVKKGYKMVAFVNVKDLRDFLPEKKFKHYIKEKERLNITVRGITSNDPYSFEFNKEMFSGIKKNIWPELRFVPHDIFPVPGEITMFDNNKISIIKFTEKNPIGVVIEDKIIHDMMYSIFELSWVGAKHIK